MVHDMVGATVYVRLLFLNRSPMRCACVPIEAFSESVGRYASRDTPKEAAAASTERSACTTSGRRFSRSSGAPIATMELYGGRAVAVSRAAGRCSAVVPMSTDKAFFEASILASSKGIDAIVE